MNAVKNKSKEMSQEAQLKAIRAVFLGIHTLSYIHVKKQRIVIICVGE